MAGKWVENGFFLFGQSHSTVSTFRSHFLQNQKVSEHQCSISAASVGWVGPGQVAKQYQQGTSSSQLHRISLPLDPDTGNSFALKNRAFISFLGRWSHYPVAPFGRPFKRLQLSVGSYRTHTLFVQVYTCLPSVRWCTSLRVKPRGPV